MAVADLLELLAGEPEGLDRLALRQAIERRRPGIHPAQIERDVERALAAGRISEHAGRLRLGPTDPDESEIPDTSRSRKSGRPLRAVAFDVESVVRPTAEGPEFREARMFQLGAVRFGRDKAWCHAERSFSAFVELPGEGWEIHSEAVRRRYEAERRPAAEVLEAFRAFVAEADVLVAYNGTGVDFPLLAETLRLAQVPSLEHVRFVDGYYLALCLWPTPPRQHRLKDLCERVGAKTSRLAWHDARDDSVLLARLLAVGARQFGRRPDALRDLIASVARDSDAWELLFDLAGATPAVRPRSDAEAAAALGTELARKPPRRPPAGAATPLLSIPAGLLDAQGNVSPYELACAAGRAGEPRPAQMQMADTLRQWVGQGRAGLLEAPTGTGKSYAMLAVALEWLAASPTHKVIIATFTKQLQAQLAADIEALATGEFAALAAVSDMVKGKGNRLSLRGLVAALADCSAAGGRRRPRVAPFAADVRYRELVIYLALRLCAPGRLAEEWEGRSVDDPDTPAFFRDYCGGRAGLYLASVSQANVGEYAPAGDLGPHTDEVREAISNHRLIVANHALLLANLDELAGAGGSETLLLVDEAHMLEDAATSALSPVLDYGAAEQLPHDIERFLHGAPAHPALSGVTDANIELERFFDTERLPTTALVCFDGGSGEVGSRNVALATPRGGAVGLRHAATHISYVRELSGRLGHLRRQLGAYESSGALAQANRFDVERFWAVFSRVASAEEAARAIADAAAAILGLPPAPGPGAPPASPPPGPGAAGGPARAAAGGPASGHTTPVDGAGEPVGDGSEASDGEIDETPELPLAEAEAAAALADEAEADADVDDSGAGDVGAGGAGGTPGSGAPPPPPTPNRVVWGEETGVSDLSRRARRYRFRLVSSPIALGAEGEWGRFVSLIARTYYISATLTITGRFDFMRERLALPAATPALTLPSPFDMASQARLVVLSDFPSWAEHPEQAVRTVAWQLAGYAREIMVRHHHDDGTATWDHGALVLTTSKRASSEISLALEPMLAEQRPTPPLYAASLLGNARAVDNLKAQGGILVGTRGLWQGVDINIAERLSVVWVNKLPFAPFADPVIAARRALVVEQAEAERVEDPEGAATERYYLPLAAIALRQAVGRLIRSQTHRGVVVISDRKLSGPTRLRQSYRRIFLGSLDPGLLLDDPQTAERGGGNVVSMAEGWRRIWQFLGSGGLISPARMAELCSDEELERHTLLPETRAIRALALSPDEAAALVAEGGGALEREVLERCRRIGGLLKGRAEPIELKPEQAEAIAAVAAGDDVLGVLPTGFGKSFVFQLPALVLPGVTVVVSPLVSLMANQTLDLNRSIGGAVRALVAPLSESNSRLGKAEVADALSGRDDHGIRIVYLSPERLCTVQFQDLIRRGVESGVVRRIAVDEAHTAVQWGDDFRPAFRRAERFLRRLRVEHPALGFTALTATANQTVREGLRRGLFGLPAEPGGPEPGFHFVTANPMRPELALYRRTLGAGEGGPVTVAGLVEEVLAEVRDHSIFYCLTVREVDALWAQLSDAVGNGGTHVVLRYHGRLTEAQKASTLNAFVEAPARGDEDFVPMIVVATSAFGLGIDRPDIRNVFVVSPPTDLAALYQQLGRAGRDCSGRVPAAGDPANVGLALGTGRGFNLVRWMTSQDLPAELFTRIAEAVLGQGGDQHNDEYVSVDPVELARDQIAVDHAAGRLTDKQAASARTDEAYRVAVVRVVSVLAGLGALDDEGDFPDRIKVLPGEVLPDDPQTAAMCEALLRFPAAELKRLEITAAHEALGAAVDGYLELAGDPGATWALIVDLHALGYLDVSQAPARSMRVGLVLPASPGGPRAVPDGFAAAMGGRAARAAAEVKALRAWYNDAACANEGLARYLRVEALPEGTCGQAHCRCSSCWNDPAVAAAGEPEPTMLRAFRTPRPRPVSTTAAGRPAFERNLDGHVEALIWDNRRYGLTAGMVHLVLRGGDTFYDPRRGHRRSLWPNLLMSRHRGSAPGVARREVDASLDRLAARGVVARQGERWRLQAHIDDDARRAARQAAKAAAAGVGP